LATVDEMRKRLGMRELGTEFSTSHFMTKNYALAEDMMTNESDTERGLDEHEDE
jgi:hypothetical protein